MKIYIMSESLLLTTKTKKDKEKKRKEKFLSAWEKGPRHPKAN